MRKRIDLGTVLDRMKSGVFVFRGDTLLYSNPTLRQLLHWTADAPLTLSQLVHPDDVLKLSDWPELADEPSTPLELRLSDSQGHIWRVQLMVTPTIWDDELAWLGTVLHIWSEETPKTPDLQAFNSAIFNVAGVGMMLVDAEGRILEVNPAFQRMLSSTRSVLLQLRFQDFTHPDDLPLEMIFIQEMLARERDHYQIEKRYVRRNESIFWSRATVSRIDDPGSQAPVFLRMVEDITPRKELEHEFLKSLSLMQAVLDATKDGVVVIDEEGEPLVHNPAFETMWHLPEGWQKLPTREERLGLLAAQIEDSAAFLKRVGQLFDQRDAEGYDIVTLKDGTVLERYTMPYRIGHQLSGRVWNFRDLTDRQRAEAALLEQERLQIALQTEQKLNVLKSNLMLTIAHEFRTPLAIIMSASELLERYADRMTQADRQEYAAQIREQIARFVEVLDDMTIVVKGQEQELDLTLTRWDLRAACREWIDEMQHTEQKHRILFDAPEQPCPVSADYSLIRRVAVSLISNAVKYDGHHSDIHVHLESLGQDVILKVTDQGIGIPPEDLPYIFDSFYRSANVGAVHGTGMGLTIVRDSVQRHGGQINVTSQEGRGTQFTVRLPIAVR